MRFGGGGRQGRLRTACGEHRDQTPPQGKPIGGSSHALMVTQRAILVKDRSTPPRSFGAGPMDDCYSSSPPSYSPCARLSNRV